MLLDEGKPEAEVVAFVIAVGADAPRRGRESRSSSPRPTGPYVFNYSLGEDIVRRWIGTGPDRRAAVLRSPGPPRRSVRSSWALRNRGHSLFSERTGAVPVPLRSRVRSAQAINKHAEAADDRRPGRKVERLELDRQEQARHAGDERDDPADDQARADVRRQQRAADRRHDEVREDEVDAGDLDEADDRQAERRVEDEVPRGAARSPSPSPASSWNVTIRNFLRSSACTIAIAAKRPNVRSTSRLRDQEHVADEEVLERLVPFRRNG